MEHEPPFAQSPYRVKLDWGRRGVRAAAQRGEIVVIVDVLSFSTTVVAAVARGAAVYPARSLEEGQELAARYSAKLATPWRAVLDDQFSLSPLSMERAQLGMRIVLPSPNGATCSNLARDVEDVFVGALRNAGAVGRVVTRIQRMHHRAVTVVACGERWPSPEDDEGMRVALEDLLGAGAILAGIDGEHSPEARAAVAAFLGLHDDLATVLLGSGSGQELAQAGFREDVAYAACLDASTVVPVFRDGAFRALEEQ